MRRTKQQILADIRKLKVNPDNYTEQTVRADPYSLVAERMLEKLPNSEVFDGMSFKEVRKYCKEPIMTSLYNSVEQPKQAFGEDTPELQAFYDTLYELFPGAIDVLEALNARWDNNALAHTWTTPDGHTAYVKVMETVHGHLESEGLNLEYRYHNNQTSKVKTSLAPNYVHSMDAFAVRYVVENADFDVVAIHDEFQAHPNNMSKVRSLYLEALAKISEGHFLEEFCEKDFGIDNTAFLKGLTDSSYALC